LAATTLAHIRGVPTGTNLVAPAKITWLTRSSKGSSPAAQTDRQAGARGSPRIMPAPGFALRLMLGEMADALLLSGQKVVPAKATRAGFTFKYQRVDEALGALFTQA
jgi:NAD dependent epimerase/dehydratase family enzyme